MPVRAVGLDFLRRCEMNLCFYYDARTFDLWAHLVDIYKVSHAYVVSLPEELETESWSRIDSVDEAPGPCAYMSPSNARYSPGKTPVLPSTSFDAYETFCFGANDVHNKFKNEADVFYVPTPGNNSLWAVQVAGIVLHNHWVRHGHH